MKARSIYALTQRKQGWDCMRHVEILAAGCIPFFVGLLALPPCVAAALPRQELLAAATGAGKTGSYTFFILATLGVYLLNICCNRCKYHICLSFDTAMFRQKHSLFARTELRDMAWAGGGAADNSAARNATTARLLTHTRRHLTTAALARFFLQAAGVRKGPVLVLSPRPAHAMDPDCEPLR